MRSGSACADESGHRSTGPGRRTARVAAMSYAVSRGGRSRPSMNVKVAAGIAAGFGRSGNCSSTDKAMAEVKAGANSPASMVTWFTDASEPS